MKNTIKNIVIGVLTALLVFVVADYAHYKSVTNDLMVMIEETAEHHGLSWGDTIAESYLWEEFANTRRRESEEMHRLKDTLILSLYKYYMLTKDDIITDAQIEAAQSVEDNWLDY